MSDYKYCEIVTGGVNRRGNVIEIPGQNTDLDYYGKQATDAFHSAFMHTIDYKLYDDGDGGKAGYNGSVDIACLYWDFDSGDLRRSQQDAIELVGRLTDKWLYLVESNIRVYYSGNKGFHVLYLSPEIAKIPPGDKHAVVKRVCNHIARKLETYDKGIYAKTQVIRTPNSKHSVSGLYKIPLTIDELNTLSIDVIKGRATQQRKMEWQEPDMVVIGDELDQLLKKLEEEDDTGHIQVSGNYSGQEILRGILNGFTVGERNNSLASFCGILHGRGFSDDWVEAIASAVNSRSEAPLSEVEVKRTVSSVCRYAVDQKYLEPKTNDIITIGQALDKHIALRQRVDRIDTGYPHLNAQLPFFDPGEVFMICARSGGLKTSWGMQFANNISRHCVGKCLFASLEMPDHSIGLRAAMMQANNGSENLSTWEVSKELVNKTDLYHRTKSAWGNMLIVDKSSLTLEQIESYYNIAQEMYGGTICSVLLDYVGLVNGAVDYEGTTKVAKALKGLAKRLQTRLVVIVQLSRAAQNGRVPVEMHMLRDSGSLEEGADYIYGTWVSRDDDKRIHVKALKNRWLGERDAMFDLINHGLNLTSTDYLPDMEDDSNGRKW